VEDTLKLVYFACAKGKRGEAVVEGLNQAILQVSRQPEYQKLMLQGIAPAQQASVLAKWLEQLKSE